MNESKTIDSNSNDYDYYDYQDTESLYYIVRGDYLMKQQDPEIINKRLISTSTSIDRQDNILTLIGPVLVGIFVLISTVSALVSLSAACASIAVAEELSDSTPSISLVCKINVVACLFILKKRIPQKLILRLIDLETTSQLARGTLVPIICFYWHFNCFNYLYKPLIKKF